MANANLNIKLNPQIDIQGLKKQLDSISGLDINLDVNDAQFEDAIEQALKQYDELENALGEGVDIKVNSNVDAKVKQILKQFSGIEANLNLDNVESELQRFTDEQLAGLDKAIEDAFDFDNAGAGDNIKKLASEFDKTQTSTRKLVEEQKRALAQMKLTGSTGTSEFKKLEAEIDANEKQLKELDTALGSVTKNMNFTDKLAKFGLVADGIDHIANSVNTLSQPFVELDTATNRIKTLGGEAKKIAPELRTMSLEMSKDYPIGAAALQTATYDALSAGIKATEGDIEAFMTAATKLAVGGGEEVGNTVNLLSSLVNAYGESADKTGDYSDILFTTVNLGKTNIQELSNTLSNVIPTAAAYGMSMENVGASLALMTANGIPTAQATTKLNQLLLEMQKPGAELEKIMKNAGVSVESLGKKVKEGNVVGALKDLDSAFKQAGLNATQAFSSSESGAAFNVLTKDFEKLQGTVDAFADSAGATDAAYSDMSSSIENRSKQLQSQVEASFTEILDSAGVFGDVAVMGGKMFDKLSPMMTSMAGFKTIFGDMGKSALGFANTIIQRLLPNLFAQSAATGAATGAQTGLNAAMLANPAGAIAIAIAAIAAALYLFVTKTETGRELFEKFKEGLSNLWDIVEPAFDALLDAGKEVLNWLATLGEFIYEWLIMPFEIGSKVISAIINWFMDFIGVGGGTVGIVDLIKKAFEYAGKAISSVTGVLAGIIEKFKIAKTIIGNFVTAVPDMFKLLFDYAKYYLNPVNWVDGDDKYEAYLSQRFSKLISTITDTSKAIATKNGATAVQETKKSAEQVKQVNEKEVKDEGKKTAAVNKTNKAKRSAVDIANEAYGISKKALDQQLRKYELDNEELRISQKRNANEYDNLALQNKKLESLEKQKQAYLDAYKSMVTLGENGELQFKVKLKDSEKSKLTDEWNGLLLNIQDETNKREAVKVKIGLETQKFEQEFEQFRKDNLRAMVELGLAFPEELVADAEKDLQTATKQLNQLIKQRDDLKLKMAVEPSDEDSALLEELNKKILLYSKEELSAKKKLNDEVKTLRENRYRSLSELEAKEMAELEKAQQAQTEMYGNLYSSINEITTDSLEHSKDSRLDALDSQMNQELARVGDNERAKAAVTEKYSKLKIETEKEYAIKGSVANSVYAGEQRAFEDAQLAEKLKLQKEYKEKELRIAQDSGDTTKAAALDEQIDELSKEIASKSDTLNTAMELLGQGANNALVQALGGDTEGAKEALRGKLSEIAGYIKKLVTTYVINLVLSSPIFTNLAALAGPLAPAVTSGFIGLMSAGVNAIVDPLLSNVLAFNTGSWVNQPTLALIGDAAKQGGDNKEAIVRSDQMQAIIQQAIEKYENKIYGVLEKIISQPPVLIPVVDGEQLSILYYRNYDKEKTRTRTKK